MKETKEFRKRVDKVKKEITRKLGTRFGTELSVATPKDIYKAAALTAKDEIMTNWSASRSKARSSGGKELYYLSFEFLMGRTFGNNLMNMLETGVYTKAVNELGFKFEDIEEIEHDAGLGNGGLGRLAACFLDSLATLTLPAYGCGIRYEYGLFRQKIVDGYQTEMPDIWLDDGNIWEVERPEEQVEVYFGGTVHETWQNGKFRYEYENAHTVIAVPYDTPICGYNSGQVNTLRLWSAKSPAHMDMADFNEGKYLSAVQEKRFAEVISEVLYPEDDHEEGKQLRLKQQYFFVSATLQWMLRRFKKRSNNIFELPSMAAVHINDTHPTLAIPEMMRLLMDEEGLSWEESWEIVKKLFAYTNHTIMAEALEKWPVGMFKELLPRIYMIVHEINERVCRELWDYFPGQKETLAGMAVEAYEHINMANLCFAACFAVNGVSKLHTGILKEQVAHNYCKVFPHKFLAITNGVTPRRWLKKANPELAGLITETIGEDWILDAGKLAGLKKYSEDSAFLGKFRDIKQVKKAQLADYIEKTTGICVDTSSIFDVHVKRLHEYKRQLLNVLHIMHLCDAVKSGFLSDMHPRTFIFAAKASPGYARAKLIIKLINNVAKVVNGDPELNRLIKVVFIENYGVSVAEKIISAAEVSEQISTAGKEASGTGNMKFMLNGALTVGTLDGANVEMREQAGAGNIFIFGLNAEEVKNKYSYQSNECQQLFSQNFAVKQVLTRLIDGTYDLDKPGIFQDLYNCLLTDPFPDPYMVLRDFDSYCKIHERVDSEYKKPELWWKKAVLNTASAGYFSSDRTIKEYSEKIWKLQRI